MLTNQNFPYGNSSQRQHCKKYQSFKHQIMVSTRDINRQIKHNAKLYFSNVNDTLRSPLNSHENSQQVSYMSLVWPLKKKTELTPELVQQMPKSEENLI